jgi:hypothetical protein
LGWVFVVLQMTVGSARAEPAPSAAGSAAKPTIVFVILESSEPRA